MRQPQHYLGFHKQIPQSLIVSKSYKKIRPTINANHNEEDELISRNIPKEISDNHGMDDNMMTPTADFPVVVGTIIFVYSIYFIYLALFTDEVLDPRIPLAL
jgi:hypothetical protein